MRSFYRRNFIQDRMPEDWELYQVQALFGYTAPGHLARMQQVCDAYGRDENGPAVSGGPFRDA